MVRGAAKVTVFIVRVTSIRVSRCRKLSMRSHQRLHMPYLSVTTRPMATLTYRGGTNEDYEIIL